MQPNLLGTAFSTQLHSRWLLFTQCPLHQNAYYCVHFKLFCDTEVCWIVNKASLLLNSPKHPTLYVPLYINQHYLIFKVVIYSISPSCINLMYIVYMHFLHSGNMKDFIVAIQKISLLQYQKCKKRWKENN